MFPNGLAFFSGAIAMGFALAGLHFLRFWRRSRDNLFLAFAAAFWLLMLPPLTAVVDVPDEPWSWIYLFRIGAYLVIISAVVVKNRHRVRRRS